MALNLLNSIRLLLPSLIQPLRFSPFPFRRFLSPNFLSIRPKYPNFLSIRPQYPKVGFHLHIFTLAGERGRIMASPVTVKEKIDLTEKEEKIFKRLLGVLNHFGLDTQLRVAGGWVRDKVEFPLCPSLNFNS